MIQHQPKKLLRQNWPLYLTGLALILGLKLFYSRSDSESLIWILAPTARWVGILSGLSFENLPHTGYINHDLQFVIAKSCSGLQFMIICAATLIFSYVHRMKNLLKGFAWIGLSLLLSYIFTVLVNGFRILLAVFLPPLLEKIFSSGADSSGSLSGAARLYGGWLTPDRLHTLIGTVVYFSSLFLIYRLAGRISLKASVLLCEKNAPENSAFDQTHRKQISSDKIRLQQAEYDKIQPRQTVKNNLRRLIPPAFWYFFIVLGIPVLNRAYRNDFQNFVSYAGFLVLVCSGLLLLFALGTLIASLGRRGRHLP